MENSENLNFDRNIEAAKVNRLKAAAAVLTLLLVGSLVWAAYTYNENNDLTGENVVLKTEKEQLLNQRTQLEGEVSSLADSLSMARNLFYSANQRADSLQIRYRKIQESIDQYKNIANTYKNQAASVDDLKRQIATLKEAKGELSSYRSRIAELENENSQLKGIVVQLRDENKGLLRKLNLVETQEAETKEKLSMAENKAEIYRVDVKDRRDKLKLKARRVKTITVLFDLPKTMVGSTNEPVYLSITDLKMVPIPSEKTKQISVEMKGGFDPISYQSETVVDFTKNPQRVAIQYEIDDKLKPGVYMASLYSKKAYLGKIEFSLR